jgi:hypothetical protein
MVIIAPPSLWVRGTLLLKWTEPRVNNQAERRQISARPVSRAQQLLRVLVYFLLIGG